MTEQPALQFGGLLRQLRAGAKLTQEELAEAASLSPRSVSDLERGINRTARKDTAVLLAGALGLPEPVGAVFVAAARGRTPAAEVVAALRGEPRHPGGGGGCPAWGNRGTRAGPGVADRFAVSAVISTVPGGSGAGGRSAPCGHVLAAGRRSFRPRVLLYRPGLPSFYPGIGSTGTDGGRREGHALDIAIAGGSAAGLFAALLLARAGHQALVLERDFLSPAPDVESAAAAAFRPLAPQIVQPHIVMARCRQLLIERLPDVYAGLLAAGVAEAPLRTQMPDSLPDTAAWPGDELLTAVMTRRSTVDWVLQRAAAAEPGVTVRSGVKVTGLLTAPAGPGGRPAHVTGVRTGGGDLPADLVVDATGRRSPVDDWLTQAGARATATWRAECGIAYFSRHYRVRPGAGLPAPLVTRTVVALDEFTAGKWGGDNGAVQMVVAPLAADRRFRTVRDPQVFTAVLRAIPACAAWLEVMDPISGVFPMAGLDNTLRRLVAGGVPVATGLHAIGDSVCTTNPTLGRGLGLALSGAADLADTIGEYPADPAAQALALDRLAAAHVVPFYQDQAVIDAARLAMMRHTIFGSPPPPRPETPGRVTYSQLRAAASYDPAAFRALWRINGMTCPPEQVYTDPDVVARTHQTLSRHSAAPPVAQPTREELLTALTPGSRPDAG